MERNLSKDPEISGLLFKQSTGKPNQHVFLPDTDATHCMGRQLALEWIEASKTIQQTGVYQKDCPIVLLMGELGAGKTSLVKGIANGLGIQEPITSPSFALAHHYKGQLENMTTSLVHIDLYRLENSSAADELFVQEEEQAYEMGALIAVEWPERLSFVPENSWKIQLNLPKTNDKKNHGRELLIEL